MLRDDPRALYFLRRHAGAPGPVTGFGVLEVLGGTPVVSTDCLSGPAAILESGRYGAFVLVQGQAALASAIEHSLTQKIERKAWMRREKYFQ